MLFFLLLSFNFFSLIFGDCPNGLVPSSDNTLCYSFFGNSSYFFDAQDHCKNENGSLAVIKNLFDGINLAEHALMKFTESTATDFWIGATDLYSPGNWTWIDDTPMTFTDWDNQEPKNLSGSDCGAVIMQGGKWIADDCFKQKPYVCSKPMLLEATTTRKPISCPNSWTYYAETGFCYITMHNATWIDAGLRCSKVGACLASIHSLQEAAFVATLSGGLIGLYTETADRIWKWTDDSPVSFLNWATGEPDNAEEMKLVLKFGEMMK